MSDFNGRNNRAVWFDIPVADLARASAFYAGVLGVGVQQEQFGEFRFAVLEHADGNGGCLVVQPGEVTATQGILLYLNVEGRMRDAVAQVLALGGAVLQDVHEIGPHGVRAIVRDSEGNRVALHATRDG